MLSESHDTDKILYFLLIQKRLSECIPNEVVTDMSRALLNAVTRAYTQFRYIEEYADAYNTSILPNVYIRLDNAHFIHLYPALFRKKMYDVNKFYMGSIGQLIMCRSKKDAEKIVRAIFTIALSTNYGKMYNRRPSSAQRSKEILETLITGTFLSLS